MTTDHRAHHCQTAAASYQLPPGWIAIPAAPTAEQWMRAQGVMLDHDWDAVTCLAAQVQELIAATRKQWAKAASTAQPAAAFHDEHQRLAHWIATPCATTPAEADDARSEKEPT